MKQREDDFAIRREPLKSLSDEALKERFFELADKIVDPLITLAYRHTTKSIERSVLLRMGISSIDATRVVDLLHEHGWLKKGAGHCVYKLAKAKNISLNEAVEALLEGDGVNEIKRLFV